jgi:hypothetical protein
MAGSPAEILVALQNGVTAINNLTLDLNSIFATRLSSAGNTSRFTPALLYSSGNTAIIAPSSIRYGIMFHNPSSVNCYVFQTGTAVSSFAGTFAIYPGGTLTFPSANFPPITAGFSGFVTGTSSSVSFTVVEFF